MHHRKRVLVTGGAGFLGSHLCERLLEQGASVICLDNYFTGTKDNVLHLMANPQFELLRHDVTLPLYVEDDEITGPVNLGNPMEFSILDLAQKIISLVGSDSDIEFKPLPPDDPIQRRPDIGRARELLNWEPRVELDQGLKKTIAYFENLLKKTSPR